MIYYAKVVMSPGEMLPKIFIEVMECRYNLCSLNTQLVFVPDCFCIHLVATELFHSLTRSLSLSSSPRGVRFSAASL